MSKQSANFKLFVVRQRERDNASLVDLAKMYGVDYAMIRTWWQRLYDEGGVLRLNLDLKDDRLK